MIVIFGIIVQKIDFKLYTILYAPIRAMKDIYVLQSGKLCRIRSQYFGFKGQSLFFKAWRLSYRKIYISQEVLWLTLARLV